MEYLHLHTLILHILISHIRQFSSYHGDGRIYKLTKLLQFLLFLVTKKHTKDAYSGGTKLIKLNTYFTRPYKKIHQTHLIVMRLRKSTTKKLTKNHISPSQAAKASKSTAATTTTTDIITEQNTEIVIVSDTVRQRRARTPLSSEITEKTAAATESPVVVMPLAPKITPDNTVEDEPTMTTISNVMPDLLPQTFRLAESSALFSQIRDGKGSAEPSEHQYQYDNALPPPHENTVSVVEIRESNTTPMMSVQNINVADTASGDIDHLALVPKLGAIVNTISILESVDTFEPEFVETVNIVDASSDTDTCPSPAPPPSVCDELAARTRFRNSFDELEEELEKELETLECFHYNVEERQPYDEDDDEDAVEERPTSGRLIVERQRISFDEKHPRLCKDGDMLHDDDVKCEQIEAKKTHRPSRRIIPTLREILNNEERDSFYNSDKENNDEPLTFSDDEDIPRFSLEMAPGDSDSDTVCVFVCVCEMCTVSNVLLIVLF